MGARDGAQYRPRSPERSYIWRPDGPARRRHARGCRPPNSITPAVLRDEIEKFRGERERYITSITELRDRLKFIGVEAYKLEPASAEIGLLLPRDLFNNELSGLVKELHTLNRII